MSSLLWKWLSVRNPGRRSSKGRRERSRSVLQCECLEARDLPATGIATPTYILLPDSGVSKFANPGPTGYTPTQITTAYGINQISFNGTPGTGAGTTIAIVDAYNDPNIASDLKQFDAQYSLPNPTLTVENQTGSTSNLPAGNTSWAEEIALDVEWAHAVAPGANILLVEASSASMTNLLAAVQTAAKTPGVVAVSMSWGGSESAGETSDDSYFTTPGVTFLASSGDSGAPTSYPSASPNVVSVGGTTLSAGNILSESGWSDSGGGISAYESQPSYQKGVVTQTSTQRADPDVAYDADPNTGFSEYNSYSFPSAPWQQFGGTSDASPQWAGIIAIADQGRADAGLGSLSGATQTLPMLYSAPAADFHDVTTGTSLGTPEYTAGTGYDLVTGRGTPVANSLVAYLVDGGSSTSTVTHFSVTPTLSSETAGTQFSITVDALNSSGSVVPTYAGTVQFGSTDLAALLPANYKFTVGTGDNNGVATFTVTLKTAGSQTVSVADTSASGVTGTSTAVSVTPSTPDKLAFVQPPSTVVAGAAISPAVTVEVLDTYGNLETADNTDQLTLALGSNPGSATLGGTTSATVSGGIATFSTLTVSATGNGYTLMATDSSLPSPSATSASFNVNSSVTRFSVTPTPLSETAGTSFSITVTALNANNQRVTNYTGTVQFSSSDLAAMLPASYTFTTGTAAGDNNGVATFTVTLKTAGSQSVGVADTSVSGVTGSVPVTVTPSTVYKLTFVHQPTNAVVGAVISPAVTVEVFDMYGNLETGDTTDQVTLALGNAGSATLGGTVTETVSGGIATFSTLTVSAAGTGYTLNATSGTLPAVASTGFNITATSGTGSRVIEGFETSDSWYFAGNSPETANLSTAAAHDGNYGLVLNGNDWIYRTDSAVQVNAGDTLSAWVQFSGAAIGRAYLGFGTSAAGTLAVVAAPNTNQLLIVSDAGFGANNYATLAAANQKYLPNHWYLLEVNWSTGGKIVVDLFDSNGTTPLGTVSAASTSITTGGIALRAFGDNTYIDTVTDTPGVNTFIAPAKTSSPNTPPPAGGGTAAGSPSVGAPGGQSLPPAMVAYFASFPGETAGAEGPGGPASWASWFEMFPGSK